MALVLPYTMYADVVQFLDRHIMTSTNPNQEKVLWLYAFSDAVVDPSFKPLVDDIFFSLRRRIDQKKEIDRLARQRWEREWRAMAGGMLTHAIPLPSSCIDEANWSIYDDVGRAFGIPPVVLAATHWIETTCRRWMHVNGPYQIMSHQYTTWDLSDAFFFSQTVAVARFIHNKVRRYNSRNPDHQLLMAYTGMSVDDVVRFGALYNGLSGGRILHPIAPARPVYVWGNWGERKERKNGLIVAISQFLAYETWLSGE